MYDFYKKCELSLKNKIIELYGKYFSETKLNAFKSKEYITDYVMGIKKFYEVFDYLSERMLNDLLTVTCTKRHKLNEEADISLLCGTTLKTALKNYYKIIISKHIPYNPRINYDYAFDIDTISYLNEYFDNVIDKNVFSKTAIELEQIDEISAYIDTTITRDLDNYVKNDYVMK